VARLVERLLATAAALQNLDIPKKNRKYKKVFKHFITDKNIAADRQQ
jgi:hypothetical protein